MTTGMLGLSLEWKSVNPYTFGCIYRLDLNTIGIFTSFVGKSLDEIEIEFLRFS